MATVSHLELWGLIFRGCTMANCPICDNVLLRDIYGGNKENYSWDLGIIVPKNGYILGNVIPICHRCYYLTQNKNLERYAQELYPHKYNVAAFNKSRDLFGYSCCNQIVPCAIL